jgi:hypothetical protein
MILRWVLRVAVLVLLVGMRDVGPSAAQPAPQPLAAVLTVLSDGVVVQLTNTDRALPLRVGAVAPLGAGDRVLTGVNGRAVLTFGDEARLYLLPESAYTLDAYTVDANGHLTLSGALEGIAIQAFEDNPSRWEYRLHTRALTVTSPAAHFAVWAIEGRFEAVVSASGVLTAVNAAGDVMVEVEDSTGWMPAYNDAPVALEPPFLHPVPLLIDGLSCTGTVTTGGGEGLRLRRGAALDYPVVGVLFDGQQAGIAGITQNGLWYRIQYQTGFGWLFSDLVDVEGTGCANLPISPNLARETNEYVEGALTEVEQALLLPFYGTRQQNIVFYR